MVDGIPNRPLFFDQKDIIGVIPQTFKWWFPKMGGTPSSHPFIDGFFPWHQPANWGTPRTVESHTSLKDIASTSPGQYHQKGSQARSVQATWLNADSGASRDQCLIKASGGFPKMGDPSKWLVHKGTSHGNGWWLGVSGGFHRCRIRKIVGF